MNNTLNIYVSHVCRKDFIKLQLYSIKKYVKTSLSIKFIVINDASNEPNNFNMFQNNLGNEINNLCNELNIECINFPYSLHINRIYLFPNTQEPNTINANTRCSDVCQLALKNALNDKLCNKFIIMDGDMFFVKNINIDLYFKNIDIAYVPQYRNSCVYPWNAFVFFDKKISFLNKFSFDCGKINNNIAVDCGGQSYHFLLEYKNCLNIKELRCNYDFINESGINDINDIDCGNNSIDDFIFHYHGGGNWQLSKKDFHIYKTRHMLYKFYKSFFDCDKLDEKIKNYIDNYSIF